MINLIKGSESDISNSINQNLEIISNLSNYVIYLISDIIQYVNIDDMNNLKMNISILNFKEIIDFCYQS